MKVVVTGAAGYIGGQTALKLLDAGHEVIGIDRRPCPRHLADHIKQFVVADIVSKESLSRIVQERPDAIIHCAGTSLVGPSIKNPAEYYDNNVVKTIILLNLVCKTMPTCRFVFSSSAAVYGTPVMTPCHEVDPKEPISPYGESKLMVEMIMNSYRQAYGLDYVSFRYFNACGADSQGRHGQEPGATHIIARVLEALRDNTGDFVLNGTDFETEDGTCVRDYVHVEDLADAHVMAIDSNIASGVYNLGTSTGYSNLEIIHGAIKISQKDLEYNVGTRRVGDPAVLTADCAKFTAASGWKPQWKLEDIIKHAWAWYLKR